MNANVYLSLFSNFLCSDSNKCFCAKVKRQQQVFSVRKRSGSNKCFLCESEAAATTTATITKE
ncbi:hypothetical protein [Lysinibacillus xylanilyticus]|uniref:hypothetical protein n=1 Tax=Lysinibacillus xylanilyticus TaxID=582475 RepID=UPI00128C4DC3|nr:hypothetical protein [Lysinibacillus xylanilyticus]